MANSTQWRYTFWYLQSGQARAYGPTVLVARVKFEVTDFKTGELVPAKLDLDYPGSRGMIERVLKGLPCGYTDFTYPPKDREATTSDYFATRLEYIKIVEPGVIEFKTLSEYTG